MSELQRISFCHLVGIEVLQLRSLGGRGLLPFSVDQTVSGRGYSCVEALLLMLMQELAREHTIGLARASEIAARLPPVMTPRWADITATAQMMAEGTAKPVREVLGGRVTFAYPAEPLAVCGNAKQIEVQVAATGLNEIASVRTSISRPLSTLISRARMQDQKIPRDFWSGPLKYRPKPPLMTPNEVADALTEDKG